MSIINTISGVSSAINVGGAALSLVPAARALFGNNKDKLKKGIDGFLFDIITTDQVDYSAQITDHYVEDNTAIQDHIALSPVKITITGKIAELVNTKQEALAFLSAAIDRLGTLGIFTPSQGLMARKAISSFEQAKSAVDSLKKTYTSLKDVFLGNDTLNKQQTAFKLFKDYFENRALISVETPWTTYTNMAIESWTAEQGEETNQETTFTINFKQMRFVSTSSNAGTLLNSLTQSQKALPVNKGVQTGETKESGSILNNLIFGKSTGAR